ncbi:hypothetical protein ARMSODRAFT_430889 [Armillaria solidipes]|uniref:Uncharacterized protein n=1 Tax=Armillaria solidipes TaxID=1076256 RepID=A0A2H3B447_9AGAR|nr:hypothetical protein ARMSODRAFT_430889 [Armillaria solidipes]
MSIFRCRPIYIRRRLQGGPIHPCFTQHDSSFVSTDWLHQRGLLDNVQHNLLLQCIGPVGSFVFLMPFQPVELPSFDVSLGRDVFAYYNEVLASTAVTTDSEQCADDMDVDVTLPFVSRNDDPSEMMDIFQLLDRDYPVDDTSIACCSEDAFASGEGIPSSPLASGRGHCFSAENGDLAAGSELPSSSGRGTGFAVSVIHGMLFGRALTGSRSLVFTSDRGSLLYSAGLHGLSLSQDCTVVECQYALLAHMLMGCFYLH